MEIVSSRGLLALTTAVSKIVHGDSAAMSSGYFTFCRHHTIRMAAILCALGKLDSLMPQHEGVVLLSSGMILGYLRAAAGDREDSKKKSGEYSTGQYSFQRSGHSSSVSGPVEQLTQLVGFTVEGEKTVGVRVVSR
jgi:hypothetical protein